MKLSKVYIGKVKKIKTEGQCSAVDTKQGKANFPYLPPTQPNKPKQQNDNKNTFW